MLQKLKEAVWKANMRLGEEGLVILTWGNASAVDREKGVMVIKPSGVAYETMKPKDMVVVSLASGKVVEGKLRPSSDAPTHRVLYESFSGIGAIVHTHSLYATVWAQAGKEIPPLGTTHADHFYGAVPCTRAMTAAEINEEYERNTGLVIQEKFKDVDPMQMPAVLVSGHAPFTWGTTMDEAVKNAVTLERVARMASETLAINPSLSRMSKALLDKHFLRKHGPRAYYGQKKSGK